MSNQGLDALAALASAVSPTSTTQETTTGALSVATGVNDTSVGAGGAGAAGGTGAPLNSVPTLSTATTAATSATASMLPSPQAGAMVGGTMSPHQWQQAVNAAAASINTMGLPNMALLGAAAAAGLPPVGVVPGTNAAVNPNNPMALMAFQQQLAMQQQMNYYQLLAQSQQRVAPPQLGVVVPPNGTNGAALLTTATGQQQHAQGVFDVNSAAASMAALAGNGAMSLQDTKPSLVSVTNGMPPPQAISVSTIGIPSPPQHHTTIAPLPHQHQQQNQRSVTSGSSSGANMGGGMTVDSQSSDNGEDFEEHGDKRQLKRVANRRSAQLSRKRKKQFIEELKDENDGLRRKEQILKSIPDLIVVFDSSGKLWFVSESVSRFLDFSVDELEGTSFWNRLCEDSIRLLKAAFMDSLAARQPESETAPLGTGFWKLRLVDKDGTPKVVTLNGVVHFAGDRPECVCSIRPHEESKTAAGTGDGSVSASAFLSREPSFVSSVSSHQSLIKIMPQQSVVLNDATSSTSRNHRNHRNNSNSEGNKDTAAVRISDSGNSSGSSRCSDSGSSDEQNMDDANMDESNMEEQNVQATA